CLCRESSINRETRKGRQRLAPPWHCLSRLGAGATTNPAFKENASLYNVGFSRGVPGAALAFVHFESFSQHPASGVTGAAVGCKQLLASFVER
ncbi:MAG: hypothetical protein Q8O14_00055, partial [bacterium]|nr:hypothetical protein [bacterium]